MPSLESVLAAIPGYGGYLAKRNMNEQGTMQELQQAGILASLAAAIQQQKQRELAMQKEQRAQAAMTALGSNPSEAAIQQWAATHAGPEGALKALTASRDRQASIEAAKIKAASDKEQRLQEIALRGQDAIERVREAAAQNRITREEADRREAAMRENLVRLTAGLRPAPAPAITEIVDPQNPSRMLRIQVDREGGQRVIGVSGKEPTAAKREEEKEHGRRQITTIVDDLAAQYDKLQEMKAVITPTQGAAKNIWERTAAGGPGQTVAGFFGTKAQAIRDQINNKKPLLMAAIKQASGMSSQQLNSNAELQFYLQASTDPAKSLEANRAALAILDQTYGLGVGVKADPGAIETLRKSAPKTTATGQIGGAAGGDVRFLGFE